MIFLFGWPKKKITKITNNYFSVNRLCVNKQWTSTVCLLSQQLSGKILVFFNKFKYISGLSITLMQAWKLFKGNWHCVASALFTSSLSVAVSSAYWIWEIRDKFPLIHFSCINMKLFPWCIYTFELPYKAVLIYANDASRADSTDEFIFEFLLNWMFFLHIFREFLLIVLDVVYIFHRCTVLRCMLFNKGT